MDPDADKAARGACAAAGLCTATRLHRERQRLRNRPSTGAGSAKTRASDQDRRCRSSGMHNSASPLSDLHAKRQMRGTTFTGTVMRWRGQNPCTNLSARRECIVSHT